VYSVDTVFNTKKHAESADLCEVYMLNFVKRHILCQNYFCQIAKFGEDIKSSMAKLLQWKIFSTVVLTFSFDLHLWKVVMKFVTVAQHLCHISWISDLLFEKCRLQVSIIFAVINYTVELTNNYCCQCRRYPSPSASERPLPSPGLTEALPPGPRSYICAPKYNCEAPYLIFKRK